MAVIAIAKLEPRNARASNSWILNPNKPVSDHSPTDAAVDPANSLNQILRGGSVTNWINNNIDKNTLRYTISDELDANQKIGLLGITAVPILNKIKLSNHTIKSGFLIIFLLCSITRTSIASNITNSVRQLTCVIAYALRGKYA